MIEFYPQIKLVHVAAVLASGGLFLLRALGALFWQKWAMAGPVRYLSYSIDTVLLTAALMLMTVLHQFPIANSWLTVKNCPGDRLHRAGELCAQAGAVTGCAGRIHFGGCGCVWDGCYGGADA